MEDSTKPRPSSKMPPRFKTGDRIEMLVVLSNEFVSERNGRHWLVRCDCGVEKYVHQGGLVSGQKSCGCIHKQRAREANLKHGHESWAGPCSGTYNSWRGARERSTSANHIGALNYSERGITMCERWLNSFEAFLQDMGEKPTPKHTLERIDNNGTYEPTNCRWATRAEQSANKRNNRRFTFEGESLTAAQWSRRTGINQSTLYYRLAVRGWSVEKALNIPVRKRD